MGIVNYLTGKKYTWLKFSLLIAKKILLRHWKDISPSAFGEWALTTIGTISYKELIFIAHPGNQQFSLYIYLGTSMAPITVISDLLKTLMDLFSTYL